MDQYFQDIVKYNLLSPEEEKRLAFLYKEKKCEKAREKILTCNLRFVVSIAKKYVNQGLDLEDLISEGNIGLIKALDRFEPELGFKFITYASWWIRQSILQALTDTNRTIRIPANKKAALDKIKEIEQELAQDNQSPPTLDEIQKEINKLVGNISVENTILETNNCLDLNNYDINDNEILEQMADPNQTPPDYEAKRLILRDQLEKAMEGFSQREKDILYLYHGLGDLSRPLTLEEIGNLLNITRERVRQIKEQVLKKLKSRKQLDKFKEIL